jgi:hypothetical protein
MKDSVFHWFWALDTKVTINPVNMGSFSIHSEPSIEVSALECAAGSNINDMIDKTRKLENSYRERPRECPDIEGMLKVVKRCNVQIKCFNFNWIYGIARTQN